MRDVVTTLGLRPSPRPPSHFERVGSTRKTNKGLTHA